MAKKGPAGKPGKTAKAEEHPAPSGKPSALLDARVVYCGDCLEQLEKLPAACVDLVYIDPVCEEIEQSFNSNRNYEVFRGEEAREANHDD